MSHKKNREESVRWVTTGKDDSLFSITAAEKILKEVEAIINSTHVQDEPDK